MISYHRNTKDFGNDAAYARGFTWAPIRDFKRLATAISTYVWSPCRWRDGRRHGENFLGAQLVALDFDDGEMTLADALNVFCDSAHIIGTTKSHQREKNGRVCDRFRVVLLLDQPVTDLRTYRATVAHYIWKYDCDRACKDGARFFWPCLKIVSIEEHGYAQDIKNPPPPTPPRGESPYRKYGIIRRRSLAVLQSGFVPGSRNTSWFMVAKDLYDAGRDEAEILRLITDAPPYNGHIPAEIENEVRSCIANGIASVESGKAYGGEREA